MQQLLNAVMTVETVPYKRCLKYMPKKLNLSLHQRSNVNINYAHI